MIYLDNGATSFCKPPEVCRAVCRAMYTCANPGRGGYRSAMEAGNVVFQCREAAAALFDCEPEQVVIVHAFGVSSRHQGKGLGSAMMRETIDRCRAAGDKAMRLDLIDLNRPAEKVYLKLGFVHCASVELYYEEVGWQFFHMFELAL